MRYELFINGEWVKDSNQEYFPAINPYTQEVWAEVPQATEAQVARAIDCARAAFDGVWSKTSGAERARLLNKLAELLEADAARMGVLESTDNGKVIRETSSQMLFAAC